MTQATASTPWGEIDGRTITFPMEVADLDAATLVFSVPADAAQALIPGDDFEVARTDDRAQLVMALCDYHRNPWGDYLEVNLGFLARPVGAPAGVEGSFIYRMPVDQAFTCRAGNEVMGFPKTVEDLSLHHRDGRVTFAWRTGDELVLSVAFDAPAEGATAGRVETTSYSYLHGVAHQTPLAMDLGAAVIDPATLVIELGPGAVANELRSLGLPTAPDLATWGTGLSATFQLGHPLR